MQGIGGVDADPAVYMLGGSGDARAGFGGPEFRDPGRPVGRAFVRDQPCRVPGGPAHRLDVDERVGQPLLHRLEAADRAPELLTLRGVRGGHPQGPLGHAELDRAQPDQGAGVQRLDQPEPAG